VAAAIAVLPLTQRVERHRKRPVMVAADLVRVVALGNVAVAAASDWLHDLDEQARAGPGSGFGRRVRVGTTVWRLLTRLDTGPTATALAGWLRTRQWGNYGWRWDRMIGARMSSGVFGRDPIE
jgi:hypothetical protein